MKVDADDFRKRFAETSDEGLRTINRDELVDAARRCYDAEVASRGLESEADTHPESTAMLEPVEVFGTTDNGKSDSSHIHPLRAGFDLLRQVLVAIIGTAIVESPIYSISHPDSIAGAVAKEAKISAVVAFALGVVSQRVWKSKMIKWMPLLGILTFATTLRFEHTSVLERSGPWHLEPLFDYTNLTKAMLWFLSVRLIAYPCGAFCYGLFAKHYPAQRQGGTAGKANPT